jgi:hypothetical protein
VPRSQSLGTLLGRKISAGEIETVHTAQIAGHERKIEEIRGPKRRKIAIDAQKKFAEIRIIKAAKDKEQEAVEQGEAYTERGGRAMAHRIANEMMNREIDCCITIWQL